MGDKVHKQHMKIMSSNSKMWPKIEAEVRFKSYINYTFPCLISPWRKPLWVFVLQDYKDNFREQELGCVNGATRDQATEVHWGLRTLKSPPVSSGQYTGFRTSPAKGFSF